MGRPEVTPDRIDMCLASPFFYPTFSGAGARFQRYAPGLKARGIDMHVFTGTPEGKRKTGNRQENAMRNVTLLPIDHLNGLPIQRVQLSQTSSYSREIQYVWALLHYCRHPATRPDLIHILNASEFWLPYFFSFRRLGFPIVQSHTLLGSLSSRSWKRRLQSLFWRRLPFQLADCVVTASVVGRDSLRNIGVSTRIEVIPNGLDLNRFKPIASSKKKLALRAQLGVNPNAEMILFVGALIERKGVDVLVEAWGLIAQKRPRATLVLVGPDKRDMRQDMYSSEFQVRVETAIASSGAADRVKITGRVEKIENYFQSADVFVFPSRREGMPNAVLEAFGCGLATVLTPFIGLPDEFGQPDEQYILVERTPQALAEAIITLLENPGRRQQLARQSRKWIEEQMDVESSLDRYAALYRELVVCSKDEKRRAR